MLHASTLNNGSKVQYPDCNSMCMHGRVPRPNERVDKIKKSSGHVRETHQGPGNEGSSRPPKQYGLVAMLSKCVTTL